jgi:hypothetical protein
MNEFNLQEIACKVYSTLTDVPSTRDDDKLLFIEIWYIESQASSLVDFFNELQAGVISFPDTVTRIRRKLQEKHKSLRGDKWDSRHQMEGAVCQQLTFFDRW